MLTASLRAALLCAFAPLALASGQLDPAFDDDGVQSFNAVPDTFGRDHLHAGLVDSAGRYVGVGYGDANAGVGGVVVRVHANGERDASFGSDGVARLPLLDPFIYLDANAVVEQADGKLVIAGRIGELQLGRAYVCRLLPSGALDPQYGGGCVSPSFHPDSSRDFVADIALQADGRVVLVGGTDVANDGGLPEYAVARLNADGTLDKCFGDATCQFGGVLIEPEADADLAQFVPHAVAVAQDQKIVLAGQAAGGGDVEMAAVRLQPTGAVDLGFGSGGHQVVAFDQGGVNYDRAFAVYVRGDNSIVLAGEVQNDFAQLVGVAALDALGAPINGFGTLGKQILFFNDVSPKQIATGIAQQADGKLVLSGYIDDPGTDGAYDACGVARLTPNGQLDAVFAFNGAMSIDAGMGPQVPNLDRCSDVAVDADGIVLFGRREINGPTDTLFLRLDQDALFSNGFE